MSVKPSIKLVAVGDGAVGKTCLLIVYTTNKFPTDYIPTVFDNMSVEINVNKKDWEIDLFDTAGQEQYERLRPMSYPNTNVFLVCFSVMNRDSFQNVKHVWKPELNQHASGVPIMLVGTKADLRDDAGAVAELEGKSQTPVTEAEAKELQKQIGAVTYVECSAKTGQGVKDVFQECISTGMKHKLGPDAGGNDASGEKDASGCGCVLL